MLHKLKVGSVHGDWKEVYNSSLFKYFPISKVVELQREILSFRQLVDAKADLQTQRANTRFKH